MNFMVISAHYHYWYFKQGKVDEKLIVPKSFALLFNYSQFITVLCSVSLSPVRISD